MIKRLILVISLNLKNLFDFETNQQETRTCEYRD